MRILPSTGVAAIGLACIAAAGFLDHHVAGSRTWLHSGRQAAFSPARNEPPLVVFATVALGGFRGILVDVLWAKATFLQEAGDYIEIAQLSDWITKLEPRLPVVWDYHSFNMAYNLSIMFPDPADRWRWVSAGIRMLRDEAIVYNPREAMLYDRICRIYMHKMVEPLDPARPYYRLAWAKEMNDVMGPPGAWMAGIDGNSAATRRMRIDYKLEPAVMLDIDRRHGPLDWRLPETHVIYWAKRGARETSGLDALPFDIIVCGALGESYLRGRVIDFRPSEGVLATGIRGDLLGRTLTAFEETSNRYKQPLTSESGLGNIYRNFLRRAVLALVAEQRSEEALSIFRILRDTLHDHGSDRPFDEYVDGIRKSPHLRDPEIERAIMEMRGQHNHGHDHDSDH